MKQVRQLLNLPQNQIAIIAGVSQATVCRWEQGQWEPNRDELERIRNYALKHGYKWEDAFFFPNDETPKSSTDGASS
jgi:transcriptional regulator with XRE-family HTH domain